jgi:NitT/TauT family transport system substrate-binding protein
VLLVGTLAACGGAAAEGEAQQVGLRLDFVHTGKDAIWTYGVEKGYFSDAGIDLEIEDGKGSATTGQTVGNGADELGLVDGGTLITLVSKDVPLKAVASVFAQSPLAVLSPADDPVNEPADLEGRAVAVTSGDGPSTLLAALLDRNNVDTDAIDEVNLQPQAKLTSLLSGDVEAVATTNLVKATLSSQGMATQTLAYRDFGVATPGWYLATSEGYLGKNPDVVESFVEATQKAVDATVADPDAAVASFVRAFPEYDEERARAELDLVLPLVTGPDAQGRPTAWMSPQLARSSSELLAEYADIDPKPVDEWLHSAFVE